MSKNLTIEILEVNGLEVAARYVGLPVGKIRLRAEVQNTSYGTLTQTSLLRLSRLIAKGDEHAKIMRQVTVHMEITGPRYWWQQFTTYESGVEGYSGSTMHTLMKGVCKENFVPEVQEDTSDTVDHFINKDPSLKYAKANLPEGFLQTRLVMCSYQTLRRIWLQRRKHKLGEWHEFIESMHELPYCHDLIFVETRNPWRELWEQWFDFDKEPWEEDYLGDEWCFFCGTQSSHSPDCIYLKAKQLLDEEAR